MKRKSSQIIPDDFSKSLTSSQRRSLKIESDRGAQFYNSFFQNFLRGKNIQHYSRFTNKSASIVEKNIRTTRNLLKKPVLEKGNADWLSELSSVINNYNNTIHHSIKMTPIQASKKSIEKAVFDNLKDKKEIQKPKLQLAQLVGTVDNKRVFSKGVSTNWSKKLYTITEVIHYTIPSS